jgi:hypothetical protein
MPDCSVEEAALAGERIRRAVTERATPHGRRPMICWAPGSTNSVPDLLHRLRFLA